MEISHENFPVSVSSMESRASSSGLAWFSTWIAVTFSPMLVMLAFLMMNAELKGWLIGGGVKVGMGSVVVQKNEKNAEELHMRLYRRFKSFRRVFALDQVLVRIFPRFEMA